MNKKFLFLLLVLSTFLPSLQGRIGGAALCTRPNSEWPPQADDSFWRDSIPTEMRQSYIAYGKQYLGKPWATLPWTVFAENKINGNRVNYERLCFDKRRQLAALVMAEIMENKGRFLNDIIDGIGSFCEETWWGIPAHYNKRIPLTGQQEVDLFNAETASLIAWTRYMLQKQFEQFSPDLCQRIDHEIEQRILVPALSKDYWWKKASMNWNPWICSNWLTCVLICEHDNTRKQQAIAQIEKATQAFIDAYPSDGGCDEGPGYWDRAAASMFEVTRLLSFEWTVDSGQWIVDSYDYHASTGSKAESNHNYPLSTVHSKFSTVHSKFSTVHSKLRNMAAYSYRTYIGNDYCVNFADAHENKAVQQVNIVYPFGLWLGDKTMREFGAWLGRQKHLLQNPAALYDQSGNFPTLGRELFFLRHIRDFMAEQPREPLLKDVWLPDLQIMTARRGPLFVAVKGGNNGESHNHNDVGSFVVYLSGELRVDSGQWTVDSYDYHASTGSKAESYHNYPLSTIHSKFYTLHSNLSPLLIDPGVGEYTAQTFSKDRYQIWTMQSAYHNLPQINGSDQKDGKQYAARLVSHKDGQLCLDIAAAYPEEAAVKSWKRTVTAMKSRISVTEEYQLSDYHQPSRLMFMTTRPDALSHFDYDHRQLSAEVEDISSQLDPILQRMWGDKMYRIVFTIRSTATKNKIKYTIR